MAINVFEGARRTAFLAGGLWAIGVVALMGERNPSIDLSYEIDSPGRAATRVEKTECGSDDANEWLSTKTQEGTNVSVRLCFKARRFTEDKNQLREIILVPYKIDAEKNLWWGASKYDKQVSDYTHKVKEDFRLTKADEKWADSQVWPSRWKSLKNVIEFLFYGLTGLWVFTSVIGWIVRGFSGIPSGQDSKPKKMAED